MVVDFAIPTVGFMTGLDTVGLGVGAFGLVDTVFVSVVTGTGSGNLWTSPEIEMLG